MHKKINYKLYGLIWIIISPILWLMAAMSTVESITTYYIQLTCLSIIAFIGFVSGVALLFQIKWAYVVLKYLSWLCFLLFSGAGVLMIVYSVITIFKGNFSTIAIMLPVAFGVVVTGLPFYLMARKLSINKK